LSIVMGSGATRQSFIIAPRSDARGERDWPGNGTIGAPSRVRWVINRVLYPPRFLRRLLRIADLIAPARWVAEGRSPHVEAAPWG
jgi:hypothetical protein